MSLLQTMPLAQLLLHIDTSWLLSLILCYSALFSDPHAQYPSFILCSTSSISCYLRPQLLKICIVSHAFNPHHPTSSTSQLHFFLHSHSTFFFLILCQTHSPVCRTSPTQLLTAVQSLCEDSRMCVRVGNNMSWWFPVNVGLRRGCVMSPWLFNVCIWMVCFER